ncbi:MAG: uracil-DNA glycosylase [Caulobacteraceae bacterium]
MTDLALGEDAASRRRAAESLLAFWAEAGVDACHGDAPCDRLQLQPPSAPSQRALAGAPTSATLDADSAASEAEGLSAARSAAAGAGDLAELAGAIAAFDGCALKRTGALRSVFSRGAGDAPLMVIGEAPGAEEDARGEPFVGRAGRLLDRMLASAGVADKSFITNTVFWRPPGNRTPTLAEQRLCAPFLERAILLVRPKLLLVVGAAAARAVLGANEGILAARGRWFEWASHDGAIRIPALPTLHPAFLLRQPEAKKKVWADLLRLAERLDQITGRL